MSHVLHEYYVKISHVTSEWVVSRMNGLCHVWIESSHIWMSHVTYEWVISHMNESCHILISHIKYEWVKSQVNESSHIYMSHVTYKWAMSRMHEVHSPCLHIIYRSPYLHMGWLRLVGSLKLQVSFAEYPLFYRAVLQKRPMKEPINRSNPISYTEGHSPYLDIIYKSRAVYDMEYVYISMSPYHIQISRFV